jgi:hypothetical protein
MWLCFVFAECLADPLPAIPCSQDVCGCVSLLNVWLILCLSFLAQFVCGCDLSLLNVWLILCLSLLLESMWLCFVPAECLANLLLVISCSQRVCDCVLSLLNVWLILCLSFLALRKYVVVFCPC